MRLVALDTSGGITDKMIASALSQVRVGDHLVMFDATVYDCGVQTVKPSLLNTPLRGRGGTLLGPVLKFADAKYPAGCELKVYSDGHISDSVGETIHDVTIHDVTA